MRPIPSALFAFVLAASAASAAAQAFPVPGKPLRVVVPFAAGGGTDVQARLVAPKLSEALGIPVLIENKPGASSTLAAQEVARATPDGHTLLYTFSGTFAQNPHTLANLPYDPFRDFTPIAQSARGPLVLVVHSSVPAINLRELITYARAHPGKLNYASFGAGTSSHINAEVLKRETGIDIVHVPYKGTGDAIKDLLSGRVQLMFDAATTAIPNVKSGKLKMLGVVSETRVPMLPDIPTIAEQGVPGIDIIGWLGFFGPANMTPETVQQLNAAIVKALRSAEVADAFLKGGYETAPSSPDELRAIVKDSYDRWGKVVRSLGLKVE
jgi:tripartite-type tricarboxylate transporter receptor subunit TctC